MTESIKLPTLTRPFSFRGLTTFLLHAWSKHTHPQIMTGNVINPTGVPGVTTTKPLHSQPPALGNTKMLYRLEGIGRT